VPGEVNLGKRIPTALSAEGDETLGGVLVVDGRCLKASKAAGLRESFEEEDNLKRG
jgi:hypothetical protein